MFRLLTFGTLSLQSDAARLPTSATQRRRLALLALLARAGERGITRDGVYAVLWPERSQEKARHTLEQLLYATRRDLGRNAVLSAAGMLRLNTDMVRADLADFESALLDGRLEDAVAVYAGPFLHGVYVDNAPEFERWAETERLHLKERFAVALQQLAGQAAAAGEAALAVQRWRQLAAMDPVNSRYVLPCMNALAEAGDPLAALRLARVHEEVVRAELDVAPDPEVLDLVGRLRQTLHAAGQAPPTLLAHAAEAEAETAVVPGEAAPPTGEAVPVTEHAVPVTEHAVSVTEHAIPLREEPVTSISRTAAPPRRRFKTGLAAALALLVMVGIGAGEILRGEAPPELLATGPAAGVQQGPASSPDPVAMSLYLRGRVAWNRRSSAGLQQAITLFREATEADPVFVDAHAGLADAYVILGYLGFLPGDATFPKGKAAALRALELDPTHGPAHASLGKALQWERRWEEAETAFLRAIEYAPEHATAHQWYALLLSVLGRGAEAVTHAQRAAELDPMSIQVHNTYGIMLYNRGALDAALRVYGRMVTNEPDTAWVQQNPWVMSNFGKVAAAAGQHQESIRLIERAVAAVPGHPRPLYELAVAHFATGDTTYARETFRRANAAHPHFAVYHALMNVWLGDLDATCIALEQVEEWGPVALLTLSGDPRLTKLHDLPCFTQLRGSLGLPPL